MYNKEQTQEKKLLAFKLELTEVASLSQPAIYHTIEMTYCNQDDIRLLVDKLLCSLN